MKNKIILHFVLICIFFIISVLAMFPLILHIKDSFPSEGLDSSKYVWNIWWMKKAITTGKNPFYSEYIYYPDGAGLTYDAFTPLRSIIALPFYQLFGLIPAHNIVIFISLTLIGYFTYLLAYELTRNSKASFLASLFFMLTPYLNGKIVNHQNLSELQYLPLFLLVLIKLIKNPSNKYIFFVIVSLTALFLTDYYQFFLALFASAFFIIAFVRNVSQIRALLISLLITYILISPLLVFFIRDWTYYRYAVLNESEFSDVDAEGFVKFPARVFFYKTLFNLKYRGPINNSEEAFLGLYSLFVVIISLRYLIRYKYSRLFLILFLAGVLFSLGTTFEINNKSFPQIPMPFTLILKSPIIGNLRAPARFMMLNLLVFALLFAYSFSKLIRRMSPFTANAFFYVSAGIITLEFLSIPISIEKFYVNEFYYSIKKDNDNYSILTFPIETGIDEHRVALAQTVHEKPVFGGFVSRVPDFITEKYYQMPVLGELFSYQWRDEFPWFSQEQIDESAKVFSDFVHTNRVKYIVFNAQPPGSLFYKNLKLEDIYRLFYPKQQPIYKTNELTVYEVL